MIVFLDANSARVLCGFKFVTTRSRGDLLLKL